MITIIWGPPRIGKTAFLVYLLNVAAFDHARNREMQRAILEKNENGFNLTVPNYAVSANFDVEFRQMGYTRRKNRFINPFRLGFANDEVKTHFVLPYETIGITEAQKYYDSRVYKQFRPWQSRFYEQHGHNHINIYMDTQRPGLIDKNIRELANFIEIRSLDVQYDRHGNFKKIIWKIRTFDNNGLIDKYLQSGKKDRTCYKEGKVISEINVFDLYDSCGCEPKFYAGHFDEDFDINYSKRIGDTPDDYKQYLLEFDDEIPEGLKAKSNKKESSD